MIASDGVIFKRCGCRDSQTRKRSEQSCPRLAEPGHGSWSFHCSVATMLGRPPTPSTLHRIRATLRSALNAAIRDGVLRDNPARLAELPTPRPPQAHVWTDT